ncbi:unnamed protein product [Phytophthora fragariaefolia]|uniref:Unnamed protein product n=1 Tax=Phytophthora fragariaefolia TaxID=1490495 RepID=A0A9W6YL32_9STRA|nr:unnamed protein product [Phytophthora fragariaefolia]
MQSLDMPFRSGGRALKFGFHIGCWSKPSILASFAFIYDNASHDCLTHRRFYSSGFISYHATLVDFLKWQARRVPTEDRTVVVVEREKSRCDTDDTTSQYIAVVVPVVDATRDGNPCSD